ncbi:MAG: alpha/beta hydrolase family protein, partial [Verrucomicrobiales bacterium]
RTKGHIGFLPHTKSSEYRNVRIKELVQGDGKPATQSLLDQPPSDYKIGNNFEALAGATTPSMAWSAKTIEDHEAWRKQFDAKMRALLGRMPSQVPLEVKWTERREFDKFTRHKIYVRTEQSYWAPVYYFVPHELKKPAPAIVCLHGHSGIYPYIRADRNEAERKKTIESALDYAVYFAEQGYVTAAIVVRGWNETAGYKDRGVTHVTRSCHQVTMNAFLLGMTPQGLRCWDAMRVTDFLSEQDEVDGERIAVAGLSGGGTLATYLPVLDNRVKLVMIGGAFSSYRTSIYAMHHCICNCLPGVMQYGDMADVVALHAPRPVLLINGVKDPIFPIAEARTGFDKLRRVYKLLGKPDHVDADFFDGPHAWSNNKTIPFLEQHFGLD